MKPMVHAESTAKRLGGKPEDYLDIHQFLDSSRDAFPDLRHRTATHNSWFITVVLPKTFGETRINSDKKSYSVRDVGEHHVLEDFGGKFIPSLQDYLENCKMQDWMDNGNGTPPPSHKGLVEWSERPKKVKGSKKKSPTPPTAIEIINHAELKPIRVPARRRERQIESPFLRSRCGDGRPGIID